MDTHTSVEEAIANQIDSLIIMCQYFGWDAPQTHLIAARDHLLAQKRLSLPAQTDGDTA